MSGNLTIRRCLLADEPLMAAIVNDAAQAYKGIIPADRWYEPYMPLDELRSEIAAGVRFWGAELNGEAGGKLVGIMGSQDVDISANAAADAAYNLADNVADNVADNERGGIGPNILGKVTLIRHAYVRTAQRGQGIGGALLQHLMGLAERPLLMGTWAAATWAVSFYQKHGFILTTHAEKETLLRTYWDIPARQVETSVVLADARAIALIRR